MEQRDIQRARAAQVGLLMKYYRESFSPASGDRVLTQEGLLRRMGMVESEYAERFSHATVSRWESGSTRPTLERLKVFGKALNLSTTETAGLVLLAGLASDFRTAWASVIGTESRAAVHDEAAEYTSASPDAATAARDTRSFPRVAAKFALIRFLPLAACVVGAYAMSFFGWSNAWIPTAYVAVIAGIVLAQGFLLPDRDAPLREFFWVSVFFVLTTPMLQFAPIRLDPYNFHVIGNLAGTQLPFMLALLLNLAMASAAGLMFQWLWLWQYAGVGRGRSVLQRAAWVALPPVFAIYALTVFISNLSVTIQLAVLMPALGVAFTGLLVISDPGFLPSVRDRLYLLSSASVVMMLSAIGAVVIILAIFLSPDLPSVLPDHNLFRSWEIDFSTLGLTREEALDRVNLGYLWHATWVFAYMLFAVGARLVVALYRIDGGRRR